MEKNWKKIYVPFNETKEVEGKQLQSHPEWIWLAAAYGPNPTLTGENVVY